MLTQGLSLRSSRVGYARVSRTRPTRRPTTSFISPSAILNRKPGTMRLLRGPPLGLTTTMVLLSREITSPAPPAVPSAKVPWPLRLRSLLRVLEATKPVLGREVPSVPTQPRESLCLHPRPTACETCADNSQSRGSTCSSTRKDDEWDISKPETFV